jgi:hypothetical protein
MRQNLASVTAAVTLLLMFASTAAFADKGCNNIPSKCAIEIGGRCDPVTGKWVYGRNGAGGNTRAFDDCISRATAKKK